MTRQLDQRPKRRRKMTPETTKNRIKIISKYVWRLCNNDAQIKWLCDGATSAECLWPETLELITWRLVQAHRHTSTCFAKQVIRHHFFAFRFLETTKLMPNTHTHKTLETIFLLPSVRPMLPELRRLFFFLMCLLSLRHSTFSSSSHWLPSHCAPFYCAGPLLNDFYFPSTQNGIEKMLQLRQQAAVRTVSCTHSHKLLWCSSCIIRNEWSIYSESERMFTFRQPSVQFRMPFSTAMRNWSLFLLLFRWGKCGKWWWRRWRWRCYVCVKHTHAPLT